MNLRVFLCVSPQLFPCFRRRIYKEISMKKNGGRKRSGLEITRSCISRSLVCAAALLSGVRGNASVALLVGEPYGTLGGMSPTGHAAIYMNRVCAETPT